MVVEYSMLSPFSSPPTPFAHSLMSDHTLRSHSTTLTQSPSSSHSPYKLPPNLDEHESLKSTNHLAHDAASLVQKSNSPFHDELLQAFAKVVEHVTFRFQTSFDVVLFLIPERELPVI